MNNRIYKFRAWDKEIKKMEYNPSVPVFDEISRVNLNGWFHREEFEFMQFTGLLDKKGKEIYEGDICQLGDSRIYVEFSHGAFWFMYNNNDGFTYDWAISNNQWDDKDIEIIGNIFENPELLK